MVVGICGGYQMLGLSVEDPSGIEGSVTSLPGLGLLPIRTIMDAEKTTKQGTFSFEGQECHGYEIHQGVSEVVGNASLRCSHAGKHDPLQPIPLLGDHCIGTYIHGFLDNAPVIEYLLRGKTPAVAPIQSYTAFKEEQYDKLAAHVRQHVDIDRIYQILSSDD